MLTTEYINITIKLHKLKKNVNKLKIEE